MRNEPDFDPNTQERRRYAILAAAASIHGSAGWPNVLPQGGSIQHAVQIAEQLLAEVERWEAEAEAK